MGIANKKGIALYLVLATLVVIIILANIVLGLVSNQSRFAFHQTSRIQAYYAAQMGVNYAMDRLISNDINWTSAAAFSKKICRTNGVGCFTNGNITESSLPSFINSVNINITSPDPATGIRTISVNVMYTYNPSS